MYDPCHRRPKYQGLDSGALGYVRTSEEPIIKLLDLVGNIPFTIAVNILVVIRERRKGSDAYFCIFVLQTFNK